MGVILSFGVGAWMVLLRHFQGGHEHAGPSLAIHWLGDATLALPGVIVAVALSLRLAARKLAPGDGGSALQRQAIATGAAAPAAALAFAASYPARVWLFGASESDALPPPVRIARDTLLALALALPLAALGASLLLADRRSAGAWRVSRSRAILLAGSAALLAAASLGGSVRAADPGPGAPCPAAAPVKTFDVSAIDVDITLNRFGDHDPTGKMYVLTNRIADVRAEEHAALPNRVSIGLKEDPIQPLALRANEGDCVEITFRNSATGGPYGIHIDGLSYDIGSSGDAIGQNPPSDVALGDVRTYRYYIPNDPTLEGAHYMRPGPGNRQAVAHGLFGVLAVEPPGSSYLNMTTGAPIESGWEASIIPGAGKPSFREFVQIYHEVGDEDFLISTKDGGKVPLVDPITTSYRPDSRAINYRSEAFMNRLQANEDQESQGYGSYAFGDPATPMMRGYLKDPTKIRLVHGGGEMFHVFHLHGGGDRWRFNPLADKTNSYSQTGLNKTPNTTASPSTRLDSQSFGPGESYNLEIEGGAGGVQQAAGDFLYHCHIAEHYISGMWSFWRVYDTSQPDLAPLPDRVPPAQAIDSAGLIGKTFNGMTITPANVDDWIRGQLPPQGVPKSNQDASVWNWTIDSSNPLAPVYLGEPEDKGPWPDLPNIDPSHPGSLITDLAPGNIVSTPTGDRPKIMFDPINGRPAWPLMRPHIGDRPPFSPNGHSGAPWLGENGGTAPSTNGPLNPYASRDDGLCPAGSPVRHFNVVAITLPIQNTKTKTDPTGMIYTLAHDKDGVYAGTKPAQPLALRSNIGDCDAVTLTSEETDATQASGFAKVNMHIHHVQFDPQASDGVISGMSFEQSVRPYKAEDPTLTAAAAAGDTTLSLSSVGKFIHSCAGGGSCDHVWIGIGLGTEQIEVRQIASVDVAHGTVTLTQPLANAHPLGDAAGTEFTQYRWYPDVLLDNIFWHDHVDGIHNWGHGLVGQLIIEPKGSTYHDPKTGAEVDSGTIVDIHTSNPLLSGVVTGSFREMALWTIDENPNTDATLNLKAEPWADRLAENPDQSLLFSSYAHGDPITPLPKAYPGDPFVIRTINVGPTVDGLHIDGHRFTLENRYLDANGKQEAGLLDTLKYGISEKYSLILQGGAGGPQHQPGDYLYENSINRKFRDGAWGILRVLPGQSPDLQPLPGTTAPPAASLPVQTGGRPPDAANPGNPCPATAPVKQFTVSAVDVSLSHGVKGPAGAFVTGTPASPITFKPDPLVLHVAAGDCVEVAFTNKRVVRSSFHVNMLLRSPDSSGVNAGFNSEQTVATGGSRTYRYYADGDRYETALISDYGAPTTVPDSNGDTVVDPGRDGMYGAIVVAPAGATFTDPQLGGARSIGTPVDVHIPGKAGYRDYTLMLGDEDEKIGQNEMPYPTDVHGPATINYDTAGPRIDGPSMFSSAANGGDPETPLIQAYPGDPIRVHAISAPANEQPHSFNLGGLDWSADPGIPEADTLETLGVVPMGVVDAHVTAGSIGDYFYGDLRRPFTVAGMWGLQRVLDPVGCPMIGVDGHVCGAALPAPTVTMTAPAVGGLVSGNAVTVSANASDPSGIASVQFQLDGNDIGSQLTSGPFMFAWNSTTASDGSHILSAVAKNNNGVINIASIPVSVDNGLPSVSVTAPLAGATVSGANVALAANASDTSGIESVQFKVDGSPVGGPDTSAPFSATWNTTALADGPHSVSATARDAAGNLATTAISVNVSNTVAPPPSGLVAAYGFNEGSGAAVGDASGKGNSGTAANTTWSATGKYGKALSFNGTNSIVSIPNAASLQLTSGMTLEAWANPSALGTTWRTLLFKQKTGGMNYALYANNNLGKPNGQADIGGEKNVVGTAGLALNAWSHVAATYDGSALKLYVNGSLVATTAVSGPINTSNGALTIGGNTVWNEWFKGLIDEVRVYNRSLSQSEIQTDMATPVGSGAPAPGDTTLPTVSMTAPLGGATVSGANVTVSANASDNVGVAGVQFKVDGNNIGAEDASNPYSVGWNSTGVANGLHTLTAVARDAAGNTQTASVSVTVSNAAPPPPGSVLLGNAATEVRADSNAAGQAEAFKTTAAASGSVTQLRVYIDASSTAGSVVVGLYTNNAGHPGALLASGTISSPQAGQNNTVTVPATAVSVGQTYWIAVLGPTGTLKFRDRGAVGAGSSETSQQTALTSLPATWTTGSSFTDGLISAVGIG